MAVAGGDNRDAQFFPPFDELLVYFRLSVHVREIHQFKVQVLFSEVRAILLHELGDSCVIFCQCGLREGSADGAAQSDEAPAELAEELPVHARFVVHAFQCRLCCKLQEIFISLLRFSEENERVPLGIYAALLIVPGSHGNICFQPQDGAYVMFMSVLVELNESVCVPLICEAYR